MIAILCGKSASGKDTLLRELVRDGFAPIVSSTSRPMREREVDGRDYFFHSREEFEQMIKENRLIEYRTYNTLVGGKPDTWYYGMEVQEFDKNRDYAVVLDLQGAESFVKYIGPENCFTCYVEADEKVREERAKSRGSFDKTEWDRRVSADARDFAKERVEKVCDCTLRNDTTITDLKAKFMENFNDAKVFSKNRDEVLLAEIRDAVKEYYKVIQNITKTYSEVSKSLNDTKSLLEENKQLREENERLRSMLAEREEMEEENERDDI